MCAMRVTQTAIRQMRPGDIIRDDDVKGFGARFRNASISYFLQTRANGRLRWLTIGKHGSPWTPETARRRAREMLASISAGEDPGLEKAAARNAVTTAEAISIFFEEHGPKLAASSREEYERLCRLHIAPAFGSVPIRDVTGGDVARLHVALRDRPRAANFALAVISKLMNWAETRGLRAPDSNPVKGVTRYKESRRERYLSSEELGRLAEALAAVDASGAESAYAVAAIRLLLLTGARLTEILTLQWRYVDLERGLIFLPTSKTGQKPIFLSEAALQVLRELPRLKNNPHVIVGAREGSRLINLQKPWRRIRAMAGLDDVRIHDLRHSFASFAAAGGASLPQIGALLGHKSPATTQRYAHLAAEPLHQVNAAVGDKIAAHFDKSKTRKS